MTIDKDEILGAVARGWCSPENAHKQMDSKLAMAITDEVMKALSPPLKEITDELKQEIMWAEVRVDCYCVDKYDQYEKVWQIQFSGDRDCDDTREPLVLNLSEFPAGTKVVISVPCCPTCTQERDMCDCGFDWKLWEDEQYS